MKEINENSVKMVERHRTQWPKELTHKQVKHLSFLRIMFYHMTSLFSSG